MANILAYIIGIISLILAIPAVLPLLGWFNWIILLIAAVGVLVGTASSKNGGRNFCLVVMGICALRLWAGGGLI
jgi:hypothetical protein